MKTGIVSTSCCFAILRHNTLALLAAFLVIPTVFASENDAGIDSAPPTAVLNYRIAAEDVLEISVWREPDLKRRVIVRPDGGVSFPLAGDVMAAGLTPQELVDVLTPRLAEYIPDAVVTVSVEELRGLRVYVTGNVRNPGQFEVGRYVDVLQAITLAGGFTPYANRRNVQVIRRGDSGEQVFRFDYTQVSRGRNLSQNIVLQTDDLVVVP